MRRRTSPWLILVITLVITLAAGGTMQVLRAAAAGNNADLEAQVRDARTKVSALRLREQRAAEVQAAQSGLESRLIKAADGQAQGQALMAVVRASRSSGAAVGPVIFAGAEKDSNTPGLVVSLSASGSEAQILRFLSQLEEGSPLAMVRSIQWSIPVQKGNDPATATGSANLQLQFFSDPVN